MIVQQDATQSSLFIILQVHCTCFGCQPHPLAGVHKTVTTASGTVLLPPFNVAKLAWPIILQVHSTCFGCQKVIIRSTQNCNYSLRYCAATSLQRGQASLAYYSASSLYMFRVSKSHHQEYTKL